MTDPINPDSITVTIPALLYAELMSDQALLRALEAAGVDNWEGYSEACRSLGGDDEESEEDIYGDEAP